MQNLKKQIFSQIDTINEKVITLRHDLHQHPELSGHEEHTKYLIKGILESSGYKITEFDTHFGLIADLDINKKDAKRVALRADMDALPIEEQTGVPYSSRVKGVMHACGHDSHTAIALGAAIALADYKEKLPGHIRFIFQPSEESKEGGSIQMIEGGALQGVDAIFGLHAYPYLPTGQIGYKYGVMMASADIFTIEVFGKSAHGARPHEGVDAILTAALVINSINHIVSRKIDPLHPAVISMGTIEGGKAANIICDYVKVTGTVRSLNDRVRQNIKEMMEEAIAGVCRSMGARYKYEYKFGNPELINDDKMVDIVVKAAKKYARVVDLKLPVMGGEDFANYLKVVKGAFFRLGCCNEDKNTCYPQHHPRFDIDEDSLIIGAKVFAGILKEYK